MTGVSVTAGGGAVTAVFQVASGCSQIRVSLGAYAVDGSGNAALTGAAASSFDAGGPYTLSAALPSCLYRVELVLGDLRSPLQAGAYGGGELGRRDGGALCPSQPPPPTPTPSPSPGGDGHGDGHGHDDGHGCGDGRGGHDDGRGHGRGGDGGHHDHGGGHSGHGDR